MESQNIDERMARHTRAKEEKILRSISLMSLGVAVLYLCGFVWRSSYFMALGMPFAIVEFPFPEILVPRATVIAFIVNFTSAYIGARYYDFYRRQRRTERAKVMGVTGSLDAVAEFMLQMNSSPLGAGRSNHEVFHAFFSEYIKRNQEEDREWSFDVGEFEAAVSSCFPDIAPQVRRCFIRYELQLAIMDHRDLTEVVGDTLGAYPKGCPLFERILVRFWPWAIMVIFAAGFIFWTGQFICLTLAILLGFVFGRFLARLSGYEDRFQIWLMVFISVYLLMLLSSIDGHMTGKRNLKHASLPIAAIEHRDGRTPKGLLLADLLDGYVILPYDPHDPNDPCQCVKVHKQAVETVEFKSLDWLRGVAARKERESLQRLENMTKEIETALEDAERFLEDQKTARDRRSAAGGSVE